MSATVMDVMTSPAITVQESTPFQTVAELLTTHQIAALPVTDASGRLVGLVSESDLILKEERPHVSSQRSLLEVLRHRTRQAKAAGRTAGEVMSTPPITIEAEAPIADASQLMQARRIHHLPVVDRDGELMGIVSRSDLLRVYVRTDDALRQEIAHRVLTPEFGPDAARITVAVERGVVTLGGRIERTSSIKPLVHAVNEIDGVVGVDTLITADLDDLNLRAVFPLRA